MKISNYIFVLIVGFMLFSACTSSKSDSAALLPELATAESIMYEHPDSALHILESMPMPNTADKFQHATWALLTMQARYKNYIEQSDTLINMAYDYFINKEDAQRRAMVLYYKGAICEEKHQIEEALQYYVEATKEIEKTNDYQLAHLIYAYLGNVYVYRSFGEFARDTFEKALYYAKLSQNDLYVCASYGYLAKAYTILHDQDETIRCYKEAIQIAEEKSYNEILAQAMTELAAKYTDNKDYELAWDYARRSLALKQKMNAQGLEQSYLILGDLFRHMGEADSAYYYLYKSLSADHVLTALAGYRSLYYLSKKEKDYEKMGDYCDKIWIYQDSVWKTKKVKELAEMQVKYNQQKLLNEKNLLQIEKNNIVKDALICLVLLLCIIGVLIYMYQQKLIKKERIIKKKENEILTYTIQIGNNEAVINRNQKIMEELSVQMKESEGMKEQLEEQQNTLQQLCQQNEVLAQENRELQNNIDNYSISLNEKSKEIEVLTNLREETLRLHDREKFLCSLLVKKTEALNKLKTNPKYMDEAHWEEVKENINRLYNDYTNRLVQLIPSLTESDLQICCLIKLHISNQDIATLIGISPTSVSKRKQRLKERIVQELGALGENQTLDLWLWEF